MNLTLNGEPLAVPDATTVDDLVTAHAPAGRAVAVNGAVVPRSEHPTHHLSEGDVVEVVTAVAGG